MSSEAALSPEREAQLHAAKLLFTPAQQTRGRRLCAEDAVQDMVWSADGNSLHATVRGGRDYRVSLVFRDGMAVVGCDCPCRGACKHAAALVFTLLQIAATEPASPLGRGPITEHVHAANRGRNTGKCRKFLQHAERWFAAGDGRVNAEEFFRAFGRPFYWGHYRDEVTIFPRENPPSNPAEFLAWLSVAAAQRQLSLPNSVSHAVDPALVGNCRTLLAEREAVRSWKLSLARWTESSASPAAVPEFRLRLQADGASVEMRSGGAGEFTKATRAAVEQAVRVLRKGGAAWFGQGSAAVTGVATDDYGNFRGLRVSAHESPLVRCLSALFADESTVDLHLAGRQGGPLERVEQPLQWRLEEPSPEAPASYCLSLVDAAGAPPPPALAVVPGRPCRYVTSKSVYTVDRWPRLGEILELPAVIPAAALESAEGLAVLRHLGLPAPARLAPRIRRVRRQVEVETKIVRPYHTASDYVRMRARATPALPERGELMWTGEDWREAAKRESHAASPEDFVDMDDSVLAPAAQWIQSSPWRVSPSERSPSAVWLEQRIHGKDWAQQFVDWLQRRPVGCTVELDGELASLADGRVAGRLRLDVEEVAGQIDWFDLRVALDVADAELTEEEVALLLKAAGRWVRLPGKGWRRLEWDLGDAEAAELAALGLAAHDIGPDRQRLHVLQLGALTGGASRWLPENRVAQVQRRLEEIKTRVLPALPRALTADLRPYQMEGFHFLAYLSANRFGGVLADDMGLGKTVQALAWLAWLREQGDLEKPVLVVCPKSVQDNWRQEAEKFYPSLRVEVWNRASAGKTGLDGGTDLLVIHYAQLRSHAPVLQKRVWGALIVDEAQAIKNPSSQNARAACALVAAHRLALTGTPIENRLTDLWSIFAFAMPGVLGHRAAFTRQFERRDDPLARPRLAARTRPFLLRRTKNEVARDLPERIEEDLFVELEGRQADLYRAELKRARSHLLKIKRPGQLDKLRFNILTSLLRLRQICCHPHLIGLGGEEPGSGEAAADSVKVGALLETLEPLVEEGQKVLVFSQFVGLLEILQNEMAARSWKPFVLTGDTEDRGALVAEFQSHDGPAVFLISLKAGGTGLNLTAASYVVLFDPWWNPAVEAQAIDRTHRIGQKKTVFAYRLLVKDSIEEKIRALQKHKGRLAQDILGEENFARALTLEDFRFLLGEEEEDSPPRRRGRKNVPARRKPARAGR